MFDFLTALKSRQSINNRVAIGGGSVLKNKGCSPGINIKH